VVLKPALAGVSAQVDRKQISLNESLQLVVSFDQRPNGNTPDTSVLARDFDILGTSQSSRQSYINGRSEISTDWIYTLAPKRQGTLTIPSIALNGEATQAITIQVSEASKQVANGDVFMESDIDNQEVFVQQQILLTLRIYHAVSLGRNANLSEPNIPDAIVNKLKEDEFQTRIDGRDYRVFEQKFAIFPQKSGQLDIPASVLTASIPSRRNRGMFDPFNIDGQAVRIMSDSYRINVKPQPKNYPDEAWLPAKNLRILDDWNGSNLEIKLGESLTRTVTVVAEGLLGAQIPPLDVPDIADLKIYPDQAVVSDGEGDKIIGSSTFSYAIIATREGTYPIPEQHISWWDTNAQKIRKAILPATQLVVTAGSSASSAPTKTEKFDAISPKLAPPSVALPSEVVATPSQDTMDVTTEAGSKTVLWLTIALTVVSLLWFITLALWWLSSRKPKQIVNIVEANQPGLKKLLKSCDAKNSQACLDALLAWGIEQYGTKTLKALQQQLNDEILNTQIAILQSDAFGSNAIGDINNAFATIATRINKIHAAKPKMATGTLPPLYR
jgi:hypothetical protein